MPPVVPAGGDSDGDHAPLQGPNKAAQRRPRTHIFWCVCSTIALIVLVVLVAVPIAVIKRNDGSSTRHAQSASLTADQAVNQTCQGADDVELCTKTLMGASNHSGSLDGNMVIDMDTLLDLPRKIIDAAESELEIIMPILDRFVLILSNTPWGPAATVCNESLYASIPLLEQIADSLKARVYDDVGVALSALRTDCADCAEALYGALYQENYNASVNVTELFNATETLAFHLSNALNVVQKIVGLVPGLPVIARTRRKLYRRRLLAQTDVDRNMLPDYVVDADGTAQFKKVQQAINAALAQRVSFPNRQKRLVIQIKSGVYTEKVLIPKELWLLTIIGEGANNTKITWNDSTYPNNTNKRMSTRNTYSVAVEAIGFIAIDITFENSAGWSPTVQQAVALRATMRTLDSAPKKLASGLAAFVGCNFLGHQDTLYAHSGWQFYYNCVVNGTVDYICGNAAAVFKNCTMNSIRANLTSTITAQSRTSSKEATGFVFQECDIDRNTPNQSVFMGQPDPYRFVYLGRPWKPFSRVVFRECYLGGIDPKGWTVWADVGPGSLYNLTANYFEYNNTGPGADRSRRVSWSRVLTEKEAEEDFTVKAFIHGDQWLSRLGIHDNVWKN